MDKYRMTDTKLMWHLDRLKDWTEGKSIIPINIIIGITSICNLNCSFCYGKEIGQTDKKNKFEISTEDFKKLINDCENLGIKSISIIGEGENTIHSKFDEILDVILDSNIDFGIATNGVHLSNIDKMLDAFVWIRFSISASNKKLYEQIHGSDKFDKVIDNIKKIVDRKRILKSKATIGISSVAIEENIDDIYNIAKLFKDIGVDYYAVKPCADTPTKKFNIQYNKLILDEDKINSLASDDFVIAIKSDKFIAGDRHSYKTCYGTDFIIAIDARGNVAPCPDLLRRKEFIFGNLHESSLYNIINGTKYKQIQDKVKTLDLDKDCESNCCYYHMNRFLEEIKDHKPEHINFV